MVGDDKDYPRQTKWDNITSVCGELEGSILDAIERLKALMAEGDDPAESHWYWRSSRDPVVWSRYLTLRLEKAQEPYSDERYLYLQGQRYETDDEYRARVIKEKRWAAERLVREKAEFERLQKKFAK